MANGKHPYRSTARTRRGALTEFGSRTDIGCVRDHNEDSLVVAPPLFAVADGMGGHAAGEVASEIATTVLANQAPKTPDAEALGRAVETANLEIIAAAEDGRGRAGMGTTCTAAILEGERLVVAQVGDSRAYLLHQGKLQQLTRDHSLVAMMVEAGQLTPEEARVHPRRSVITRALGTDPSVQPDLYEIDVQTGDRLLLCSDGLSVVADVSGHREAKRRKIALKTKLTIALIVVLLVGIFAGAGFAANAFVHNSAYLAEDNGTVAIYQGLPEPFLMFSYSELAENTDVPVDKLSPGVANRIREGLRVDNVEAARALVQDYRDQLDPEKQQTPINADATPTGESQDDESSQKEAEQESSSNRSSHLGPTGGNAVSPEDVARSGE